MDTLLPPGDVTFRMQYSSVSGRAVVRVADGF